MRAQRINKTGRIRGLIWNHIRKVAKRKSTFRPSGVVGGPVKSYNQARQNCFQMFRAGELSRIHIGIPRASYSLEPVYKIRKP